MYKTWSGYSSVAGLRFQHQGGLDGLCGVYAVVNAAALCGIRDHEAVFQAACEALPRKRWPKPLWEGTSFKHLQAMAKAGVKLARVDRGVMVKKPFEKLPPKDNETYWKRFDAIFEDERTICAIIGVEQPMMHWLVARRDGRRVEFADSKAGQLYFRKNRTSLYAGKRRPRKTQWRLNPAELLIFSRAPSNA